MEQADPRQSTWPPDGSQGGSHSISLSREQGTDSPSWRYGRDQTADLLGAARPSLSRELAQMSREGYLEIVGRTGTRLSVERLRSLLEDD